MIINTDENSNSTFSLDVIKRKEVEEKRSNWSKFWLNYKYLWLEQALTMRHEWFVLLIFSLFLPLAILFGYGHIGEVVTSKQALLYVISGTAIFTTATQGLATVPQMISRMKSEGQIKYYATLPISKAAFILALLTSRPLLGLVGMIPPIIFAPIIYGISIEINFWILLIIPLVSFSLAVVGLSIGLIIDSLEIISVVSTLLLILLLLASPIFVPMSTLPLPLQVLGYLLPPTYAADALRKALAGSLDMVFYLDLMLLFIFAVISFFASNRWLKWRIV